MWKETFIVLSHHSLRETTEITTENFSQLGQGLNWDLPSMRQEYKPLDTG